MTAAVDNFVRPALEAWLNNNMTAADAIVGRIVLAATGPRGVARGRVTEVKRKSRRRRGGSTCPASSPTASRPTATRPNCSSSRATRPAARPSRAATTRTQAVLPLRGKILNSEGLPTTKVLGQPGTQRTSSTAIGTGAGDKFDIDGLRYGKIILLMDADADGHHITTLLLDFFFRHMTGADPQGARLHRPAAALPHRRRQGDVLGHATTSTRKRSSPG